MITRKDIEKLTEKVESQAHQIQLMQLFMVEQELAGEFTSWLDRLRKRVDLLTQDDDEQYKFFD